MERGRQRMQQHGIKAWTKRKFVVTTDSRYRPPPAPDLVQRRFNPEAPNRQWSGDITCIATDEGWLYLAVVIDLFSRQVEGWSMQAHMQTSLVKDALTMAWFRRRPDDGLIFHSARGNQYCNHEIQDARRIREMRSSMSRNSNSRYDAPTESFWGRLKKGQPVQQEVFRPARGHGRGAGLDGFLQSPTVAFDAGVPQPDAI
jgi:putative transposase